MDLRRLGAVSALVALGAATGACELFPVNEADEGGDGDDRPRGGYYAHAEVKRYPSATLPWTMNPLDVDTTRNIWFMDPSSVTTEHRVNMEGRRTFQVTEPQSVQIVALADLVVVIFRPEGGPPQLAWAGRDTPWTSMDFPGVLGGDLDAITGPDDQSVHALSRDRAGNMSYTVWRPDDPGPGGAVAGGTFDVETLALGGATADGQWACPDLSLALSPEGHVDVAFLNGNLWHGHRDAGTGEWTRQVIWDHSRDCCPNEQGLPPPLTHTVGCRNVIGHDESGYPAALSLARPVLSPATPDMAYVHNFPRGFKVGRNGVWQQDGPFLHQQRTPRGDPMPAAMTWTGRFDMLRHPAGFLVAGVAYTDHSYWLQHFSPRYAFEMDASEPADQPWKESCSGYCEWRGYGVGHPREVIRMQRERCGSILTWIPPSVTELGVRGYPRYFYMQSYRAGDGGRGCTTQGMAPVVTRPEDVLDEAAVKEVVFTHGDAPFHAALCLTEDGRMVVCNGSYGAQIQDRRRLHGPRDAETLRPMQANEVVEIVAHDPDDGAVVPAGTPTLSVTLSDWRDTERDPSSSVVLHDTFLGIAWEVSRAWDPATRTVTLTPAVPLEPGRSFRVELGIMDDPKGRDAPILHRGKRRYFEFRTDGSPFTREDPRSAEGFSWECFERDDDGVCHVDGVDPRADPDGEGFSIGRNGMLLGYPFPEDAAVLTDPAGEVVPTETTVDAFHGTITLEWDAALEPGATYTALVPVIYDQNGLGLVEADRTVRFTTYAPE